MALRKRHLGWLLVPVLVAIALAGVQYAAFSHQRDAIRHIEGLGGRVVTTHGDPGWIRWVTSGRTFRVFEHATVVNLSRTNVKDGDLRSLQKLNGLERLNLSGTGVTDEGLRHLEHLSGLKALDLSGTRITDRGLERLRGLTALEYLYLARTKVGDPGLRELAGLTSLRHLDVTGTAVSDEGVAAVRKRLPEVDVER